MPGFPMKIDFKKELESASKGMIMIHDPRLLIKLIVRMIVRKVRLKHAAMILFDPARDSYVLSISRGRAGYRVPQGFALFKKDSPLIRLFINKEFKQLTVNRNAIVSEDIGKLIWRETVIENDNGKEIKELLYEVDQQMQMLNSVACVPAYYQDRLLVVLLLGEKEDLSRFDQEELDFFAALASDAAMAIRNAQLFEDLRRESERNKDLFLKTIIVLGSTIEAKDAYTRGHTERVTRYALALAHEMADSGAIDLPDKFFENLYIGGLLHDIGKIGVPEAILNKQGKLTPEEYEIMKKHTITGAEIVRPLALPKECVDGIYYHHEYYDGSGYPEGIKGADIPLTAAIIGVADAFDAMTSDRPYRKGLSKETALTEIENKSGIQFHPVVVRAILQLGQKSAL